MKIVYAGIDLLKAVMDSLLELGCEIAEVFTCRTDNKTEFNTQVIGTAKRLQVPVSLSPIRIEDLRRLREKGCEALFCGGYYHKIPILEDWPMVNLHPALLPVGRGPWPMPVTILKGLSASGVTLHKLTDSWDGGDILLQRSFEVSKGEDLSGFMAKADLAIADLLREAMEDFGACYRQAIPQGEGEYWPCPGPADWTITPGMQPEQIDRILRAFYGYECIWKEEGRTFELIRGRLTAQPPSEGICFRTKDGFCVSAERIEEITQDGRQ